MLEKPPYFHCLGYRLYRTETKTRTDPWSPTECDDGRVIGSKRELRQKPPRYLLNAVCLVPHMSACHLPLLTTIGCLLTATKGQEPVQMATVTITKPAVPLAIFKIISKRPGVTRTVTLTRYAIGTTVSAPETSTEHSTRTDHSLVTVTDDITEIFTEIETGVTTSMKTETETKWVAQTAAACSNPEALRKSGCFSNPTVLFGKKFGNVAITESELTKTCCDACFSNQGSA